MIRSVFFLRSWLGASPARRGAVYALGLVIALRLFTALVLLAVGLFLPAAYQPGDPVLAANLRMMEGQSPFSKYFIAPWYRWDSLHFINIAEHGYADQIETVWPPLYPLLTRAAAALITPTLLAGLLVSTLALWVALALLYRMVQEHWDEDTARKALVFLAFLPTSFFLVGAYTESIFLVLSLGCLYAYQKSKWIAAAALGMATVLTRIQGIVLVVPMAWNVLTELVNRRHHPFGQYMRWIAPGAAMCLAFGGYFFYVHFELRAAWPWQTLSATWRSQMVWPWVGILGNLSSITVSPIETNYPLFYRFVYLFLVCAGIVLLGMAWKKMPALYKVYAASQLLVILSKVDSQNQLVAAGRYLLVVFPLMVAAALTLNTTARRIWIAFSIGCQAYMLIVFYWWIWGA